MISEAQLDLLQDVAGLVLRELDLRRLSTLCSTTHVKQRLGFMQLAQREVERGRKNGHSMALLSLDIDNFNFINQYYGYGTGDHVLRKVAEFCSTQLRPRDLTGRIGADEFAILLENVNLEEAQERAEAIRCGIEEMKLIHGSPPNPILVSVSCGLTIVSDDESSIDPALQRSAAALRLAQRNGRNQVAHHLA
jgi:diguanylate cyclase (GGDEF)-like protein